MKSSVVTPLVLAMAAGLCALGAWGAALTVEKRSVQDVAATLDAAGLDWVEVASDGLRIDISGTAPDEAARVRAARLAGSAVAPDRVIDSMEVAMRDPVAPPRFSIEMLRSEDGITLIGLVPAGLDRQQLLEDIGRKAFRTPIADLLETASYPAPEGWNAALGYGLDVLGRTERAKISVAADRLGVVTMATDEDERAKLEAALRRTAPEGIDLALDISAPRPVIAPFLLRAVKSGETVRLDACTTPDEAGAGTILAAARDAGLSGEATCAIGLGAPTPAWPEAAADAIAAMDGLEDATLTISDLDVRLEAGADTAPQALADVAASLETSLPDEFSLTALVAEGDTVEADIGPAAFDATRSPEGEVRIRGRVGTARGQEAVASFAGALFGHQRVNTALEVAPEVPDGWSPRVFAALDALSLLAHGAVAMDEEAVTVSGTSGAKNAQSRIAQVLSTQLGEDAAYEIDVAYDKRIDPVLALPTPEECVAQVNGILGGRQITFDPGSAEIDAASRESVDAIAEVLRKCEDVAMEVAGFTDSQGREEMNAALSQERADALVTALMARRVLVSALSSKGYGEENPIADNGTEAGREANRRIEFRLIAPGPDAEAEPADATAGATATTAAETETDAPGEEP